MIHSAHFCSSKPCYLHIRTAIAAVLVLFPPVAEADNSICGIAAVTATGSDATTALRALVAHPHGSYQVLLWRSAVVLENYYRGWHPQDIDKDLQSHAFKLYERKENYDKTVSTRYLIAKHAFTRRYKYRHDLCLDIRELPESHFVSPVIVSTYGIPFLEAAGRRDAAPGTILDRVFDLEDLLAEARSTPVLDEIDIHCLSVGSMSGRSDEVRNGIEFLVTITLSNPSERSRLSQQTRTYLVASGLEPAPTDQKDAGEVYVSRDSLRAYKSNRRDFPLSIERGRRSRAFCLVGTDEVKRSDVGQ